MLGLDLGVFLVSFAMLSYAGTLLIRSLVQLGEFFKLSEFALSFILMSFATSIPEFAIAVSSSLHGVPEIGLGNILGSNFIGITFVIGIIVMFAGGIPVEGKISHRNFLLIFLWRFFRSCFQRMGSFLAEMGCCFCWFLLYT